MAAKQISGSTRKLSLNGVTYGVAADADISSKLSKFAKEVMQTSGEPMIKYTLQNQEKTGFDVLANGDQKEELQEFAESFDLITVVYADRAGNEYHCKGTIMVGDSTSQDNKVPISVFPIDGNWTYIPG